MQYVICFYWQGDRWQQKSYVEQDPEYHNRQQPFIEKVGKVEDDLPALYVNNLYKGVKRFADRPFEFICFTNEPMRVNSNIQVRPFSPPTRVGVLPRMWMFSKEAGLFGNQVLCLDLDIVIVGTLKPLFNYDGLFCARSKFLRGQEHKLDGDIIGFRAGKECEDLIWTPFIANVEQAERETGGRERYWYRKVAQDTADRWDKVAPGAVISYKRDVYNSRHPSFRPGASIISFHGTPRPHQLKKQWITNYWKQ